ncbi:MAG: hypothetical protein QJR00_02035 [Bacillota bacterium]|nr:hypothetical protein [Bacillota bacterium]
MDEEQQMEKEGGRRRARRKGFKHWTREEDERLARLVKERLHRHTTLQSLSEELYPQFRRDAPSVLRRIRFLRKKDPELDAQINRYLSRAQPLSEEARQEIRQPLPEVPVARDLSLGTPVAPSRAEAVPAALEQDVGAIVQLMEEMGLPVERRHRRQLQEMVEQYGLVAVVAAVAQSLLQKADVILQEAERRLARGELPR